MRIVLKKKVLSFRINVKRKIMYMKARQRGFTHPEVVAHSQDLDALLNRYQGMHSGKVPLNEIVS